MASKTGLKFKGMEFEEQKDGSIVFQGAFQDESDEELTCTEIVACDRKGKNACRVIEKKGDPRACRELHKHVRRQDIY